jgi:Flp pilus assembly protein TadG
MALGIIEIGRYAAMSIEVANAARAGAQYGAQNLATAADTSGIQNAAIADAQGVLVAANITTSSVCGCSADSLGSCSTATPTSCTAPSHPLVYVQVTATGTFNSLFGYPGIPSSITVSRTAEMPVAQ